MKVTIEFDGGTPCNIPSRGFGEGYGSYRIDNGPVVRLKHGVPMSSNAAEIATLVSALKEVRGTFGTRVCLLIKGDSQIALKWARVCSGAQKGKLSKKATDTFKKTIHDLSDALEGFTFVETKWQPRRESVAAFGH